MHWWSYLIASRSAAEAAARQVAQLLGRGVRRAFDGPAERPPPRQERLELVAVERAPHRALTSAASDPSAAA